MGLLGPADLALCHGRRRERRAGRGLCRRLLSHFRRRNLALATPPPVAPALRPSGVQPRSASCPLVGPTGPALRLTAMLNGAHGPAEGLAALAARADPQLAPAAAARPQAPRFLGDHVDAENEHFLDSTGGTGDTALDGALCTRQRLSAGPGRQPGPLHFLGAPWLTEVDRQRQLCVGDDQRGNPALARGLSQIYALSRRR